MAMFTPSTFAMATLMSSKADGPASAGMECLPNPD